MIFLPFSLSVVLLWDRVCVCAPCTLVMWTRAKYRVTDRIPNTRTEEGAQRIWLDGTIHISNGIDIKWKSAPEKKQHHAQILRRIRGILKERGKNKTIILIHLMRNLKAMRNPQKSRETATNLHWALCIVPKVNRQTRCQWMAKKRKDALRGNEW